MTARTAPVSSRPASASRFSRFTVSVAVFTVVEPRPMSIARAILGRAASRPPVFPMLFGMNTPRGQQPRGGRRRPVQHVVEDDVVPLLVAGEILRRVVDDADCAERADQVDVAGTAHPGDLGAQR